MIIEIIGWVGIILVLTAYYLVTSERLKPNDDRYDWINLIGAAFICINVFYNHAWPVVALNIVWALVAVEGLLRNRRTRLKNIKTKPAGKQ